MDITSRGWNMICDAWYTIYEPFDQISPPSYDILFEVPIPVLVPVAAWSLHTLDLCAIIWHLHQHSVSRVQHSHERSSTRFLDTIGDALEGLGKPEASTAAAKLMLALAVLNTTDAAQAWVCLLLACPPYHDHVTDTTLKVPNAAQRIALWATSAGLHLLDAARATSNIAGQATDMLLFLFLRRPSAPIKARVGA